MEQILGSYPPRKDGDFRGYATTLAAVLEGQPIAVVEEIAHPARGIATRCKFLPTAADVTDMIVELRQPDPIDQAVRRQESLREQAISARRQTKAVRDERTPESKARVKALAEDFRRSVAEQELEQDRPNRDKRAELFKRGQRPEWEARMREPADD